MATRRSNSVGRRGGAGRSSNRKFVWARQNGSVAVDDDQGAVVNLLDNFRAAYGADILGSTVMRIRGTIFWNTANVTIDAITAVSAIRTAEQVELEQDAEGPLTSMHADWMMYQTTILDNNAPGWYLVARQDIDVKSSRKMEELGETLALAFEHDAAATALGVKYILSVGLKLP